MRSVLVAAFALLVALPAHAEDIHIPLNESFESFPFDWTNQNETATVYWSVITHEGHLAVCGLVQHHAATYMEVNSAAMRRATIVVNGTVVLKGLQFFTRIGTGGKPERSLATCRVLAGPLPPRDARIGLEIPGARAKF